jgi:hypothetical protein
MTTLSEKAQEKKREAASAVVQPMKFIDKSADNFTDKRPESVLQNKLIEVANSSPRLTHAVQLQAMADKHSTLQNATAVQLMKKDNKPLDGAYLRVDQFGNNWDTLNRATYLKRHALKEQSSSYSEGKYIQHLTDGSIILTDTTGQYWRHEHAQNAGQYYDAHHVISASNADTHFWISANQKKNVQSTVQLKES